MSISPDVGLAFPGARRAEAGAVCGKLAAPPSMEGKTPGGQEPVGPWEVI